MTQLVLLTYPGIGEHMAAAVDHILGRTSKLRLVPVPFDISQEALLQQLQQEVGTAGNVLILCDVYGSTHSNVASRLLQPGVVEMVSGVNLPMLLRAVNYSTLDVTTLKHKLVEGGRDHIHDCDHPDGTQLAS